MASRFTSPRFQSCKLEAKSSARSDFTSASKVMAWPKKTQRLRHLRNDILKKRPPYSLYSLKCIFFSIAVMVFICFHHQTGVKYCKIFRCFFASSQNSWSPSPQNHPPFLLPPTIRPAALSAANSAKVDFRKSDVAIPGGVLETAVVLLLALGKPSHRASGLKEAQGPAV